MNDDRAGNLSRFTLKAGTVVKVNGIPAYLASDTEIDTNPGNFAAMNVGHTAEDPRVPSSSMDGFTGEGAVS